MTYNPRISTQAKGWGIPKDIPVMAPHDWTGEGMRYGDLHDVVAGGVTGNISPGASLSLSDNPNLNALNDSCNRTYL